MSAAALAALSGCASDAEPAAGAGGSAHSSDAGPWTYTDGTGRTVTLEQRPTRIASFADYALGFLSYGLSPVAIFGRVKVADDDRFDKFDLSDTAVVGNSYGEIDLEALAEAAPDLIVVGIYPTDRKGTLDLKGALYSLKDVEQQKQLEKIAPVVAIKVGGAGLDVIKSLTGLARKLGAKDTMIAEAKKKFDAAADDLSAVARKTRLEVTQMYADSDGIYVVKPYDEPETQLYSTLGVDFTNAHPNGYFYWDIYSWENADKVMTGDVLLVNVEGLQPADLKKQPTFASDPALVAGQVHSWNDTALDYASQAGHMAKLARILRSSKKLSG